MTLADPHPGGWLDHEILTHDEMNAIRTELLKAIDGVGGGTYTLTAPLILDGDTVRIDDSFYINSGATMTSDGDIHVRTGATLFCETGSAIDVSDNAIFSGATSLQGSVDLLAGTLTTIEDPNDVVVDNFAETIQLPLISWPTVGEANWLADPLTNGGWLNTSLSSQEIFFVFPVSAGDTISNVRVQVQGGAGAGHGGVDPTSKMRVRLYESPAAAASGGYTSLASLTDPATGAAYDASHQIVLPVALTAQYGRYYLIAVRGETGGSAASNENLIERIFVDIVKVQLVSTSSYMSA